MSDRHRVEVLERAIVKALRAIRGKDTARAVNELLRVEVDESQYPESIPLTDSRKEHKPNSEVEPDGRKS